jgi:hypothetical protein
MYPMPNPLRSSMIGTTLRFFIFMMRKKQIDPPRMDIDPGTKNVTELRMFQNKIGTKHLQFLSHLAIAEHSICIS